MLGTRRIPTRRCAPAALGAALLLCALLASPAAATFPGRPGAIAFDGANGLQAISGPHYRLQTISEEGSEPAYSPNGRRIVYVSHGSRDLTVARADGSEAEVVYESHSLADPCFSADGNRIFFSKDTSGEGYADIWSVRIGSGSAVRLTTTGTPNSEIDAREPQVAPNGRYVAFQRSGEVWTMRPDGSRQKKLANGGSPSISPNSRQIVFSRNGHLVFIGAGGGRERIVDPFDFKKQPEELTRGAGWPAFSPSGRAIAFVLKRTVSFGPGLSDNKRLAVYSLATHKTKILTSRDVSPRHLDWQPLP
ncbi:MAG TPA: LpqB family beta-propeller domain-containing protein [Solirubrobacterales bacterium]|nr:LpqB family beta-propeller domain-containing protein [Solirubrobacterales bacterium]